MKHLEKLARKCLGDVLLGDGLITKDQLAAAQQESARTGELLGTILVESRNLSEDDLARAVASEYQIPFVELHAVQGSGGAQDLFTQEDLHRYRFAPVDRFGSIVTLAVAEMPTMEFLHGVRSATGLTPFLFVAMLGDIDRVIGLAGPGAAPVGGRREKAPPDSGSDQEPGVWQLDSNSVEGNTWANIFDEGNESVLKELDEDDQAQP